MDEKRTAIAQILRQDPNRSVKEIRKALGISSATLYRYTESTDSISAGRVP